MPVAIITHILEHALQDFVKKKHQHTQFAVQQELFQFPFSLFSLLSSPFGFSKTNNFFNKINNKNQKIKRLFYFFISFFVFDLSIL